MKWFVVLEGPRKRALVGRGIVASVVVKVLRKRRAVLKVSRRCESVEEVCSGYDENVVVKVPRKHHIMLKVSRNRGPARGRIL